MQATEAVVLVAPRERTWEVRTRRWLTLARRQPLGVLGGVVILAFTAIALTSPWITPNDPRAFAGPRLKGPSSEFPLGTNNLGQNVLSRTIYGSQVSLVVGVSSVF